MTFESKHPVLQLIFDVVLTTALIVVAAAFADGLNHTVTPNLRWMYSVWFTIGGIPCLLYMRYRDVIQFDRWDIAAFLPMPLVLGLVQELIGSPYDIMAIVLLLRVCYWIRGFLPPGNFQRIVARPKNMPSNE